ncbi:MAG: phosphatase PAP2 family protein [Sphingomonadales bacterium]|nr:phosphatase PAP2 family protein [Sphingomonadales bacterium]
MVGGLLAMYFSSVGPCFAYPLLGITDFQPLMAELRQANGQFPIMVLDVQDKLALWQKYGENGLGGGITAMPSMHVSLALLFFLAVRRISAKAAWVFGLFFCVICVGSVVTGYHYAVDGLVAAAATYIIWVMTGFVLNRMNDANIGPVVAGDANQPRLLDASLLRK